MTDRTNNRIKEMLGFLSVEKARLIFIMFISIVITMLGIYISGVVPFWAIILLLLINVFVLSIYDGGRNVEKNHEEFNDPDFYLAFTPKQLEDPPPKLTYILDKRERLIVYACVSLTGQITFFFFVIYFGFKQQDILNMIYSLELISIGFLTLLFICATIYTNVFQFKNGTCPICEKAFIIKKLHVYIESKGYQYWNEYANHFTSFSLRKGESYTVQKDKCPKCGYTKTIKFGEDNLKWLWSVAFPVPFIVFGTMFTPLMELPRLFISLWIVAFVDLTLCWTLRRGFQIKNRIKIPLGSFRSGEVRA